MLSRYRKSLGDLFDYLYTEWNIEVCSSVMLVCSLDERCARRVTGVELVRYLGVIGDGDAKKSKASTYFFGRE